MLVVRGMEETDPPPPVYGMQGMGTTDQEVVEGHREGPGVETSQSPFGQVAMEGKVHRGGFGLPRQHESGVHQDEESRAGGGGQGGFGRRG